MSLLGAGKPLVDEAVTSISSSDTRGFPVLFYASFFESPRWHQSRWWVSNIVAWRGHVGPTVERMCWPTLLRWSPARFATS